MSEATPEIVLLDDGELADVQHLLDELGAEPVVLRGSVSRPVPRPSRLLVATGRRAQALAQRAIETGPGADWTRACTGSGSGRPASLIVSGEDSPSVRGLLREVGFDVLLRRPFHPTLLRLLIGRALYEGPERRRAERVALGESVTYWTGAQRRNAVLTDVSLHGGRLATRYGARRGMRLRLEIDAAAACGERIEIEARVVRSRSAGEGARPSEVSVALEFMPLAPEAAGRLAAWLDARIASAETGTAAAPYQPRRAVVESPRRNTEPHERRRHRRGSFARSVTLLRDEASRTLLGRDLSLTGMRVESHPELHVGEHVRLALYGHPREEPSIVEATVVRDDGARGAALRFDPMPAVVERRIEALVASLPGVESLAEGETEALGAVVAQILRA
jgi:hypothetical protein